MGYEAVISKIKVRPHPGADRIQIGVVCHVDVIVDLSVKEGDMGLYFAPDGQLSEEFAESNNLIGKTDFKTGKKIGGYFGKNRRVRAQIFRGVKSYGFWIPLNSLEFTKTSYTKIKEGDLISEFAEVPICNKYTTPATLKAKSNRTSLRNNKMFAKHFDTKQIANVLESIPKESIVYLTEKLHGTSGRTGYVLEDYTYKRGIWVAFLCGLMGKGFKIKVPSKKYNTITGTRNTVLGDEKLSYYGGEAFRRNIEAKLRGKLKKGEVVYYEIVGYTTTGKHIMHNMRIKDKYLKKVYGATMSYTYGCKENECELYVYRITNVNEDGDSVDLSWPMVMSRCKELHVKHVPNFSKDIHDTATSILYSSKEALISIVSNLCEGESLIDSSILMEGVAIRVESGEGVKIYKMKNHSFLMLEGLAKDRDDYCDMEECS